MTKPTKVTALRSFAIVAACSTGPTPEQRQKIKASEAKLQACVEAAGYEGLQTIEMSGYRDKRVEHRLVADENVSEALAAEVNLCVDQ